VGVVVLGWAEAAVGAIERVVVCEVGITSVGVHCIGPSSLAAERRCPTVSVSSVQIDVAVEYSYRLDQRNISDHRSSITVSDTSLAIGRTLVGILTS
jgi:hypothetical protein